MHNGDQVVYLQERRVARAKRTGVLLTMESGRLETLKILSTAPERHERPVVKCKDCKEYGIDPFCHCQGEGEEPDSTYHCGVEGCYQCEIWPLQ